MNKKKLENAEVMSRVVVDLFEAINYSKDVHNSCLKMLDSKCMSVNQIQNFCAFAS